MDATGGRVTTYPYGAYELTPGFSGVRVTRSLVLCLSFVDRCLSFCTFSFWLLSCLSFFELSILITTFVSSHSSINYVQMTKDGIGIIIWFNFDNCFTVMSYDELAYYLIFKCWLRLSVGSVLYNCCAKTINYINIKLKMIEFLVIKLLAR